jgi:hypothetical protein
MDMKTTVVLTLLTFAPFLFAQEPPPDRGVQAAREMVRGDSGKWNDAPILQVIPPLSKMPPGMNLDTWGDHLLETAATAPAAEGESWLLFRTRQLDDNDRVWVEKVERKGSEITVAMREAVWQGNYFKTFTYYGVLAVNLGKLPAGDYTVNWVVEPLVFTKFDGDGRPFAKNGRPQNWPADPKPGKEEPVVVPVKLTVK